MTKLTIELPDEAARVADEHSRKAHMTLSQWIAFRILGRRAADSKDERDEFGYPKGWFEKTWGSLADVDDFVAPPDTLRSNEGSAFRYT